MKLAGQVVLISGASTGIGEAVALAAASRGAEAVVILARREAALTKVAEGIRARGAQALPLVADVGDEAAVRRAVDEAVARFGRIDLLIANAGLGDPVSALSHDEATIEKVMDVNFFGASRLIGAALPHMIPRRRGHIVGVSSLAGYRGMPRGAAYCASKAALMTLLESYRVELALVGIPVTTILPGFVETELVARNGLKPVMAIPVDQAAEIMIRGIEAERAVLRFPTLTGWLMLALRTTPAFLFDRITRFMARDKLILPPPPSPQREEG